MYHHHLPDDVLWHVFSQNISHPLDTYWSPKLRFDHQWIARFSLKTAKSCSQVCHDWRRIILSSPNVWSKIINFTNLDAAQEPAEWLKTILRRAGNQSLCVYGWIHTAEGLRVFLDFVQQYWGRIETLHIKVCTTTSHGFTQHPAWLTITNEVSPSLRYFFLQIPFDRTCVLLNAHNPNVHYLFGDRALQYAWHPDAPLFQHLRILALSMSMGEEEFIYGVFHISRIFDVLKRTPRLEYLSIGKHVVGSVFEPLRFEQHSQLQLPFLQYLGIDSDITVCLAFLIHISPAVVCGFELNCSIRDDPDFSPTRNELAALSKRVEHYAALTNFGSPSFPPLQICLEPLHPSIRHFPAQVQDAFHFSASAYHDPDSPVSFPFAELLLADGFNFSTTTNVRFQYNFSDDDETEPMSSFNLYSLMKKFSALKTLGINWEHIQTFIDNIVSYSSTFDNSHSSFLPNLEELIIYEGLPSSDEPMLSMPAVVEFCKFHRRSQRKGAVSDGTTPGPMHTLKRLDIHRIHPTDLDVLLHATIFDGLDGVEVVFKKGTEPFVVTGLGKSGDHNDGSVEEYTWPPRPPLVSVDVD